MQVFAVFGVKNTDRVREGLTEHYPEQHRVIGSAVYLVATKDETTREVATKLGLGDKIEGRPVTSGIVVPMGSYWGRGDPDMWEWISVRKQSSG